MSTVVAMVVVRAAPNVRVSRGRVTDTQQQHFLDKRGVFARLQCVTKRKAQMHPKTHTRGTETHHLEPPKRHLRAHIDYVDTCLAKHAKEPPTHKNDPHTHIHKSPQKDKKDATMQQKRHQSEQIGCGRAHPHKTHTYIPKYTPSHQHSQNTPSPKHSTNTKTPPK